MKKGRILLFLAFLILLPAFPGCSTEKETAQRRNLMIPHKDELPRNSKYRGMKSKKTYKPKKRKHSCNITFSREQIQQA